MRLDANSLLCESCGYTLSGLLHDGVCPECGRPVAESLPERRVGSPWQRRAGFRGWMATAFKLAEAPREFWRRTRVDVRSAAPLTWLNCVLASAVLAITAGVLLATTIDSALDISGSFATATLAAGVFVGVTFVLIVLCAIERIGIRTFGRRNKWRVTRDVAATVIAHASYGWLLLPVTLPLFWWLAALGLTRALDGSSGLGWFGAALNTAAFIAGPGIPLLAFECLVYIGFRRMRFANPPGAK